MYVYTYIYICLKHFQKCNVSKAKCKTKNIFCLQRAIFCHLK